MTGEDPLVTLGLPVYNGAEVLSRCLDSLLAQTFPDFELIIADNGSSDDTPRIAAGYVRRDPRIRYVRHEQNRGYGGNQKTLYKKALELNGDIVIMLHPDYQYTPLLIPSMVNIIGENLYPVVLGSRILGKGALRGGMPLYKYWANRFLVFLEM